MTTPLRITWSLWLFAAMVFMAIHGCTPQKRLQRLVKKHPELIKTDTIRIHDTIYTATIRHDTVIHERALYDTIRIEKDRLRVEVFRVRDSVFISGTCIGDTIHYYKEVHHDTIHVAPPKPLTLWQRIEKWLLWLLVALLFATLLRLIWQRR
jgi:hypothetical protein